MNNLRRYITAESTNVFVNPEMIVQAVVVSADDNALPAMWIARFTMISGDTFSIVDSDYRMLCDRVITGDIVNA